MCIAAERVLAQLSLVHYHMVPSAYRASVLYKGYWLQETAEHLAIQLHGTICMCRLLC